MIKPEFFFNALKEGGLNFFTGVPDSTFKDFIRFINFKAAGSHIIASGEGEAMGIAAGHYLATSEFPVVYMQNSGLGNAVDPLTSLLDEAVYSIPCLLLVGWRGEPGVKDEPQHKKMGKITLNLLETLGIPYEVCPGEEKGAAECISKAKKHLLEKSSPFAIVFRNDLFEKFDAEKEKEPCFEMNREAAIKRVTGLMEGNEAIVATTGKASRELFEHMAGLGRGHEANFYTVGSMGCAAGIAFGIAKEKPGKRVFVFDGDGAVLMKMGTIATIGHYKPKNLFHLVFDNQCHDSTGGQPTVSGTTDFAKVALGCGYRWAKVISRESELNAAFSEMLSKQGPAMLVIKTAKGARKGLGRPTTTPKENKEGFMRFLSE